MHYDVNEVIACDEQSGSLADKTLYCQRNKALQNLSISAVNYLYTLDGYTGVSTSEAMFAGSKINTVKMNKSSFNSKANLKYFVNNNGQIMNLTVRTNQDKALFTKLNLSKLTVNVSTN